MTTMQNLKYNAHGGIDLEFEHPVYGLIPCSVHPDDPATAALYAEAVALGTALPYVKPLAQAQFEQIAAIEAAYTAANEAPITYAGHTFQADAASVALMAQVASALPAGASIGWYDIDNIEVPLTDVQFAELRRAILTRGQPLFAKKQTLKDAIRAATTVAEVEAVTW